MSGARLSYANVVATLALFVALGGGAYATQAGRIGPGDIKPDAIRTRHIADGSLRLRDLIAWRTADLSGGRGRAFGIRRQAC